MAANLLSAIRHPRRSVAHVRCLMDNVGDRMVCAAITRMLNRLVLVDYSPSRRVALAARLSGRRQLFRFTCLGGGRLIFSNMTRGWGSNLLHALPRTSVAFSFGTGVIDPEFRAELHRSGHPPLRAEDIDRWLECLRGFALLSARGNESQRILREHGLPKVEAVGDPALYFARDHVTPKPHVRRIGLNITDRSYFFGSANRRVVSLFAALLRLLRAKGWQITLFPMGPDDLQATHSLLEEAGAQRTPDVRVHLRPLATLELLDRIASHDVFVSVRLHSVAAALCTYTPAIMIGYQPKNYELMQFVGMEDHLRIDALDPEELYERIEALHD